MELSRRDALAALAAAGVAVGGAVTLERVREGGDSHLEETDVETLVALAAVLYPDDVDGVSEFVETYTVARADTRPAYGDGVAAALAELDDAAESWHGAPFRELEAETRDQLLRELGCDTADPDPRGTTAERIRYALVNELLYALYSSPTGGELVGIENPQGHPGGTTSYQRGPE